MRTRTRDNGDRGRRVSKRTQQSKRGYRQQGMMRTRKMTREDKETTIKKRMAATTR